MKYENFSKAKFTVEQIDRTQQMLSDLTGQQVSVRITDTYKTISTMGAYEGCEHECVDIAIEFVDKLTAHYKSKLTKLYKELELL